MRVAVGTALGTARIVGPSRVRDEGVDRGDVVRPDGGVASTPARAGAASAVMRSRYGHGDAREESDDDSPMDDGERD